MDATNAERQRRYIARLKPRAKAADEVATLKRELARAQAHIAELEKAAGAAARAAKSQGGAAVAFRLW